MMRSNMPDLRTALLVAFVGRETPLSIGSSTALTSGPSGGPVPSLLRALKALPAAQLLHEWAKRSPALEPVQRALTHVPLVLDDFHPVPTLDECHLFVDGSCLRPDAAPLRIAAWAVNLALPGGDAASLPLADGLVPGTLQSAYRAELCATISALLYCVHILRPTTVWSDCKGVVCKVRSFLCGWFPSPRCRHFDLWSWLCPHQEVLSGVARICKVDSHLDPATESTFGDEWCAELNNQVDLAAARAQNHRSRDFWHHWEQLCRHWDTEWVVAKEVQALHLRIATYATHTARPAREPTLQTPAVPDEVDSLGEVLRQPGEVLLTKYGGDYIVKLSEFASLLQSAEAPVRWISLLQLYVGLL